jgi:hypothetical protein
MIDTTHARKLDKEEEKQDAKQDAKCYEEIGIFHVFMIICFHSFSFSFQVIFHLSWQILSTRGVLQALYAHFN